MPTFETVQNLNGDDVQREEGCICSGEQLCVSGCECAYGRRMKDVVYLTNLISAAQATISANELSAQGLQLAAALMRGTASYHREKAEARLTKLLATQD